MILSAPFIRRPVATLLVAISILLLGLQMRIRRVIAPAGAA